MNFLLYHYESKGSYSMIKRELKFSRMEKVLLHLYKFNKFRETIEVPSSITQEGIAKATGLALSKVSTTARKLMEKGFVDERVLHIQGNKRRRKAYFLTDVGIREAASLKKGLELSRYIDFANYAPELRNFYGRVKELKAFETWLQSDTYKVLVVSGIAGIGKTAFVSKAIDKTKESMHIFWHRLNEWSTLRSLLARLGDFLSEMDRGTLNANLRVKDKIDLNEISIILAKDLDYLNALFVFDDYQKVKDNKEIIRFFGALRQLLEQVNGTKMIVMGREIPRFFYDEREVTLGKTVKEIKLEGLDKKSGLTLLHGKGIVGHKGKILYDVTGGHPLFLELVEETTVFETQDIVKKFMRNEIFAQLTSNERKILEIASVFRYPAYPTVYLEISKITDIEYEVIDRLVEKSLLQTSGDVCDLHDLIRNSLYNQLPKQRKQKYHKEIAKYYQKEVPDTPQSALEAQYHLIMAEDYNKAVKFVIESGRKLINNGFRQEVLEIIQNIPFESIEMRSKPEILLLFAYIYKRESEIEKALENAERSVKLFQKTHNRSGEALAYLNMGNSLELINELDKALDITRKALIIYQEIDDTNGIGRSYMQIGQLLSVKGEFDTALDALQKSLVCSLQTKDTITTAITYGLKGNILHYIGKYEESIEYLNKSLPLFEQVDNIHGLAVAYTCLAVSYHKNGNFQKAIDYFEKSIIQGEEIGETGIVVSNLANLADVFIDLDNLEKALEYCDKATLLLNKFEKKTAKSNNFMSYGIIYHKQKNWNLSNQHFKKALEVAAQTNMPFLTAQVCFNYGQMLCAWGKKKEAKKHFNEAMELYKKLGNKCMVEAVKEEMKKLQ